MWLAANPILVALFVTGCAYYTFDIIGPYANQQKEYQKKCELKGGMVYEERSKPKICIKKDIIKIK